MERTVQTLKNDENADPNALDVVPRDELVKEQQVSSRLADDVHNLKTQVKGLEAHLKNSEHVRSAYNADKQAYSEAMTKMKGTIHTLRDVELNKVQSRAAEMEQENE